MAHAMLSPSAASRWLNCPPSARLEASFPDKGSDFAREGSLAHELAELLIREKLKRVKKPEFKRRMKEIEASEFYSEAMLDHCEDYAVFVMERFAEAQSRTPDALLKTETRVDLSQYVEEGFGTVDIQIIADEVVEIIDLKYGKGVLVDAKENKQMMLYALGILDEQDLIYHFSTVRLTIYQPRINNYSSWEISVADLQDWAHTTLQPRAALAFRGEGEFSPGPHCQFCRVKAVCKAHKEMQMKIEDYGCKDPALLTPEEVADVLRKSASLSNWLTSLEEYALTEAVTKGVRWPGFKLVEGRSVRVYTDKEKILEALRKEGYLEDDVVEKKLLAITKLEKQIGKAEFETHVAPFVAKPPGKPTLAPETDKRPEYDKNIEASAVFAGVGSE